MVNNERGIVKVGARAAALAGLVVTAATAAVLTTARGDADGSDGTTVDPVVPPVDITRTTTTQLIEPNPSTCCLR